MFGHKYIDTPFSRCSKRSWQNVRLESRKLSGPFGNYCSLFSIGNAGNPMTMKKEYKQIGQGLRVIRVAKKKD